MKPNKYNLSKLSQKNYARVHSLQLCSKRKLLKCQRDQNKKDKEKKETMPNSLNNTNENSSERNLQNR